MTQHTELNIKAFIAGQDFTGLVYCRVKLSGAGTVVLAGSGEDWIGTLEPFGEGEGASGTYVPVRLRTAAGTRKMVASGAITVNAQVYGDANGQISMTPVGQVIGRALEAATAQGDWIEVEPDTDLATAIQNLADANLGVELVIPVTVAGSNVTVFNANCPRKIEITSVKLYCTGNNTGGTVQITNGTNVITDAIVCAVLKTIGKASTIDPAYNILLAGASLVVSVANAAACRLFITVLPVS
jgi:hypothetical protein